jgi:hypothetical protein
MPVSISAAAGGASAPRAWAATAPQRGVDGHGDQEDSSGGDVSPGGGDVQ